MHYSTMMAQTKISKTVAETSFFVRLRFYTFISMQDIFTYEKAAKLRELDIKYTMFIYYITTCEISINYRIDNDD